MAQEPVFNPCGERVPVLGLNPWTRDLTPTTRGGGQPPGFYLVPDPFVPAIPDPLRSPDPVVPVASVKLKSLCPNPAGNTAAERALQWQNMTPEEKASKRNEMVRASHEMDPDLWQFLYLTRNLIKATQQIAEKLVDEGWMSGPEGDKWLDLHVALIMKDSAGAEALYEGGTIRAIGPARRSRLVFRVDQAKSTQFYRKVRVYADLFFLDPEDADTPPDDPGMPGEVDADWGAMAQEFGALAADEDLPPENDGIELIEDDEERGKWTRVEIEPPPEDEEPEEEAPVDLGAGRALAHARAAHAKLAEALEQSESGKPQEYGLKGVFRLSDKKQGLHQEGSKTFQPGKGRSVLKHPNPQDLIDRLAGTGTPKGPREDGFTQKEVVECGGIIGEYYRPGSKLPEPTTRAMIHYDRKGRAHVVPAQPGGRSAGQGEDDDAER